MKKLNIKGVKKQYINKSNYSFNKEECFSLEINDLTINKGEFFGLVGPSGCGKTTLLKIIAGLLDVDKGSIYLDDRDITCVEAEKRNIGMVFQQPLLFPHMTIEKNIAFSLKMKKINKKEISKEVAEILDVVALREVENRYPSELSGGQQQRISLARALVYKPKVLLMDEPFSALDPNLREDMRELILNIHRKYGITIVFVTHDKEEAFSLFERMAIMNKGKIAQVGSPEELYKSPQNKFVAEFLGCKNVIEGRVEGGIFKSQELELKISRVHEDRESAYLIIRPECCEIKRVEENSLNNIEDREHPEYFLGNIVHIAYNQGMLLIKVQWKSLVLEVKQLDDIDKSFSIGEEVYMNIDINKVNIVYS